MIVETPEERETRLQWTKDGLLLHIHRRGHRLVSCLYVPPSKKQSGEQVEFLGLIPPKIARLTIIIT